MITRNLLQDELHPGFRLENYTLLERIAIGGEAIIWSAWDYGLERVAAIKFFPVVESEVEAVRRTIRAEADILAALKHPNIATIYDVGFYETFNYFATQYFPLGSLKKLLQSGPLPPQRVVRMAAQIVAALEHIHKRGVVHRDVKPSNLLTDSKERIYLTDFGLARSIPQTTRAFHTGHGTLHYSPPEQHTRSILTPRSDIYSLGVTLFEMLTGILPWNAEVALAIKQLDTGESLPDPRGIVPSLPPTLAETLRTLTDPDPQQRPSTAAEAFNLVAAALRGEQAAHVLPTSALENVLSTLLLPEGSETQTIEDAQFLLSRARNETDSKRFPLSLSEFAVVNSVYSRAKEYGLELDDAATQLMVCGALIHGINHDYWWGKLVSPPTRLQVCEQLIASGDEKAADRLLRKMLEGPFDTKELEAIPLPLIARLVDLAASSKNVELRTHAFALLMHINRPGRTWDTGQFDSQIEYRLAGLALADDPHSAQASRLIGHMRSEMAVQALGAALDGADKRHGLFALTEVLAIAGSLPSSLPLAVRLRIWLELARRQLLANRSALIKAYLAAALGSALGFGFYVYMTYRLAAFLDSARLLNAIGSGLLFGPILGLGIFASRLVVHRLRVLALVPRVILGTSVGALLVNVGFAGYHALFLDVPPRGWLVSVGSVLIALGYAMSAGITHSRYLRMALSSLTIILSLWFMWRLAQFTALTPLLYYTPDQPWQAGLLILVTSLLMGVAAHIAELAEER